MSPVILKLNSTEGMNKLQFYTLNSGILKIFGNHYEEFIFFFYEIGLQ